MTKEASHRIVYSSDRVSGVVAAVEAGIAVGLLRRSSLHSDMSVMSKNLGIGITPASKVLMAANGSQKAGLEGTVRRNNLSPLCPRPERHAMPELSGK